MILKVRELNNLYDTIQTLSLLQIKIPLGYTIACIAKEIHEKYNMCEEMRQNIIEKYAKYDEEGKMIFNENNLIAIDEQRINELNKELDKLFSTEVELDTKKIKLNDIKDLDLTVGQIESLIPIIEKEENY